jgi:hypothetical protein
MLSPQECNKLGKPPVFNEEKIVLDTTAAYQKNAKESIHVGINQEWQGT